MYCSTPRSWPPLKVHPWHVPRPEKVNLKRSLNAIMCAENWSKKIQLRSVPCTLSLCHHVFVKKYQRRSWKPKARNFGFRIWPKAGCSTTPSVQHCRINSLSSYPKECKSQSKASSSLQMANQITFLFQSWTWRRRKSWPRDYFGSPRSPTLVRLYHISRVYRICTWLYPTSQGGDTPWWVSPSGGSCILA